MVCVTDGSNRAHDAFKTGFCEFMCPGDSIKVIHVYDQHKDYLMSKYKRGNIKNRYENELTHSLKEKFWSVNCYPRLDK